MKVVAGIVLVVLIALLGARWTFTRLKIPLAARHIYLTGTEFIFVGLALGPLMLGLLDGPTLQGLLPLFYLALGWVGLLFGIELESSAMARFPRPYFFFAMTQAAVTLAFCLFPLWLVLGWLYGAEESRVLYAAVALAAIAVPTAQTSLALLQQEMGLQRDKRMELLRYAAALDALLALVVFGYLFCLSHQRSPFGLEALASTQYFLLSIGLGALMGYLLHLLTRVHCSEEELLLFTVGAVAFTSGMAVFLKLSPLFVTFVAGVLLANVRGAKLRIIRVLSLLEKPVYITLLILAGAMVSPQTSWGIVVALSLLYFSLRLLGKGLGGYLAGRTLQLPLQLPRRIGFGLISQGGFAAAMVVSFHLVFRGRLSETILVVVLAAIVINELLSPALAHRVVERREPPREESPRLKKESLGPDKESPREESPGPDKESPREDESSTHLPGEDESSTRSQGGS